jgi:hypothetical protein
VEGRAETVVYGLREKYGPVFGPDRAPRVDTALAQQLGRREGDDSETDDTRVRRDSAK